MEFFYSVTLLIPIISLWDIDTKASLHTLQPVSGPHWDFSTDQWDDHNYLKARLFGPHRNLLGHQNSWSGNVYKRMESQCTWQTWLNFVVVTGCYIPHRHPRDYAVCKRWEGWVRWRWCDSRSSLLSSWHLTFHYRGSHLGKKHGVLRNVGASEPLRALRTGNDDSVPI